MTLAAMLEPAAPGLWGLLAAFLAGALLYVLFSPGARTVRQQRRLHRDLAAANGLTAAQARLLWRLAVQAGQENPALVFVCPSQFDAGSAVARADAGLVRELRDKLFAV